MSDLHTSESTGGPSGAAARPGVVAVAEAVAGR
jgi:hypothetical protein